MKYTVIIDLDSDLKKYDVSILVGNLLREEFKDMAIQVKEQK